MQVIEDCRKQNPDYQTMRIKNASRIDFTQVL